MREFNYQRAHREWAFPQWEKLSDEIKVLYQDVQVAYNGTHQLGDLSMPWLEGFPEKFAAIPDEELVHAQMVIHSLGHWDCRENHDLDFPRDKHGSYWKFERLAKQSLLARGWVTTWPQPPTDQFMDHKEGTGLDNEEIAEKLAPLMLPEFIVRGVQNVNHRVTGQSQLRGHPFVVGQKHIENSRTMALDPRCAPCDFCGFPFDDHISDKVAFISLSRATDPDTFTLTDTEQDKLKSVIEFMGKMAGYVFMKGGKV